MRLEFPGKFGALADGILEELPRPPEVHTLSDLVVWLARQQPALGEAMKASRAKAVINFSVVHDLLHAIADDDEIAFLPPMSGG